MDFIFISKANQSLECKRIFKTVLFFFFLFATFSCFFTAFVSTSHTVWTRRWLLKSGVTLGEDQTDQLEALYQLSHRLYEKKKYNSPFVFIMVSSLRDQNLMLFSLMYFSPLECFVYLYSANHSRPIKPIHFVENTFSFLCFQALAKAPWVLFSSVLVQCRAFWPVLCRDVFLFKKRIQEAPPWCFSLISIVNDSVRDEPKRKKHCSFHSFGFIHSLITFYCAIFDPYLDSFYYFKRLRKVPLSDLKHCQWLVWIILLKKLPNTSRLIENIKVYPLFLYYFLKKLILLSTSKYFISV